MKQIQVFCEIKANRIPFHGLGQVLKLWVLPQCPRLIDPHYFYQSIRTHFLSDAFNIVKSDSSLEHLAKLRTLTLADAKICAITVGGTDLVFVIYSDQENRARRSGGVHSFGFPCALLLNRLTSVAPAPLFRCDDDVVLFAFAEQDVFAEEEIIRGDSADGIGFADVVDVHAAAFEVFAGLTFGRT